MRNSSWTPARRSFSCADEDCTADANLSVAHNGPCGHVGTSRPQRAARIVRSVPKPTCERRGYRQYRGYIAGLFVSTLTLAVLGLAVLFQTATRQFAADPVPAKISTANPIADRTVESPSLPLAEPTQAAADSTPKSPVTASVNTDHSEDIPGSSLGDLRCLRPLGTEAFQSSEAGATVPRRLVAIIDIRAPRPRCSRCLGCHLTMINAEFASGCAASSTVCRLWSSSPLTLRRCPTSTT